MHSQRSAEGGRGDEKETVTVHPAHDMFPLLSPL
jgi:hypothetical protein